MGRTSCRKELPGPPLPEILQHFFFVAPADRHRVLSKQDIFPVVSAYDQENLIVEFIVSCHEAEKGGLFLVEPTIDKLLALYYYRTGSFSPPNEKIRLPVRLAEVTGFWY